MLSWSTLITVQQDATQSSLFIILQVHSTCFSCQPHPSSGVHKTVTTTSGSVYIFCAATSLQCGQASLATLEASLATLEGGSCTVPNAVVTGHIFCAATSLQRGQASLTTMEGVNCTVPEAVVTVLCTHDECGWHQKHVEWTCRIINRLLCVASRWTIINIDLPHQELQANVYIHTKRHA